MTLAAIAAAGAAARARAARRASTPGRTTARRRAAARWCCSARTGRASGPRFRASPEYRDGARRSAEPLVGAGDRRAGRGVRRARRSSPSAARPGGRSPPGRGGAARPGTSPVGLLVHARAGLFVSYRGALALAGAAGPAAAGGRGPATAAPRPASPPARSGRSARRATTSPACHGCLDTAAGRDCMDRGCAVRRACPVGRGLRPEAQSAFHMAAFHGRQRPCDG